ncbi:MAG: sensor histidine kinase [Planctomycetota bacterium]
MQTDRTDEKQAAPAPPEADRKSSRLAAVAVGGLLVALVAIAWGVLHVQQQRTLRLRAERVRSVGQMVADTAEELLASDRLGELRRRVVRTAEAQQLTRCRISLSTGEVVAARDAADITVHKLPAEWSGAPAEQAEEFTGGRAIYYLPLQIDGRGPGILEVAAELRAADRLNWTLPAGVTALLVLPLLTAGGVQLVSRRGNRPLRDVRDALRAVAAGEPTSSALAVGNQESPEAAGWNRLLSENEELRRSVAINRATETLDSHGSGRQDLTGACDAMSQGLLLLDDRLRVQYANGAAAIFLKVRRDQMSDADIAKLIDDPQLCDQLRQAATGEGPRRVTGTVERRDGESMVVLRVSARPMRKEDRAKIMVTIDDVTQQKVADEARNSFVAHATHELRTPLTNIRLYVETAIEDGEEDPGLRAKCLNVINMETRRLERMVGEILSVSEIEAGSFRIQTDDVRLMALLEELEQDYQIQAKDKGLQLRVDLPPKLPVIQADRDKLALALHNLVGNALKYTPAPGQVTVKAAIEPTQFKVEVRDTGIGISDAEAERIFEKFYRAGDDRVRRESGSGLGLALAREVMRLHGGDITVESVINEGSTFVLTLPVDVEEAD